MLVYAHDRGIDRHDPVQVAGPLRERLCLLQHLRPNAQLGPSIEVFVDRVPVPESPRHIAPWSSGTEPPRRCLDYGSPIHRRSTRQPRLREQRADHPTPHHATHLKTLPPKPESSLATRPRRICSGVRARFAASACRGLTVVIFAGLTARVRGRDDGNADGEHQGIGPKDPDQTDRARHRPDSDRNGNLSNSIRGQS